MPLNRREALVSFGLAAGVPSLASARTGPAASQALFRHGVASGDPLADRVILWTRVTPADGSASRIAVRYELSEAPDFAAIAAHGVAETGPERDFTVKLDAAGLKPGRDYWYRFAVGATLSPVGRTRTLPTGRVEALALAFVTCALYPNGYFNAYDHIARSEHLDAVVELGDYIYEYGAGEDDYGMEAGRRLGRIPEPGHDLVSLADYRTRYAQYHRDPDLQAAHARAPWICVWDDHEVCNDTWRGGAENHHDKTEGAFDARRDAAMRAYFEWMPIREPAPGRPPEEIYRSFDFGDLASLTMLETRLTARSYQLEYERAGDIPFIVYDATDPRARKPVRDPDAVRRIKAQVGPDGALPKPYVMGPDTDAIEAYIADPSRTLMGPRQEAWLKDTLARSIARGAPWQVIGNEVIMARARAPNVPALLGEAGVVKVLARLAPAARAEAAKLIEIASYDQPFDLDGWDGYPAARARFDQMLASLGGGNVVVVSGDSHAFWTNQLQPAGGGPTLAAEFGVGPITSPSVGEVAGGFQLGDAFVQQKGETIFCDQLAKGYIRLELTHDAVVARMITMPVDRQPYAARELAAWTLTPTPGPGVSTIRKSG